MRTDSYDIILLKIQGDMMNDNRMEQIAEQLQGLSSDAELTTTLLNELLDLQVKLVADAAYSMAVENIVAAAKTKVEETAKNAVAV